MAVHDRMGGIPGLPEPTEFKHEPPPQPTPEQVAAFRAQITEQATEKQAAHDRDSQDARIIRALELRTHNLHVLFMNDLAILEANVKGPEKVDQVRGRTVLTIDINMTAVPFDQALIWQKPCVIEAASDCVDIHLDGHAPRPGQLGFDPARPGRVHLEFAVPSLDEVPILAFHRTEGAVFSLTPFREIGLPPLDPVLEIPEAHVAPAAYDGQQAAGRDAGREAGAERPGAGSPVSGPSFSRSGISAITTPVGATPVGATPVGATPAGADSAAGVPAKESPVSAPFPAPDAAEAGTRIRPFFQSLARPAPGSRGDVPPVLQPPVLPGREPPTIPPVEGPIRAIPVRVDGGPAPYAAPIRLAAAAPGADAPGAPLSRVPREPRAEAAGGPAIPPAVPSALPGIPQATASDAKTALRERDSVPPATAAVPAAFGPVPRSGLPETGTLPGSAALAPADGIVLRIDPAAPEARPLSSAAEPVPLETRAFLSPREPEVVPVAEVPDLPPVKREAVRGDEEEPKDPMDPGSIMASGTLHPAGWEKALSDAPSGPAEPIRDRVANESLAREVTDMVDRLLVTAEEGSYVKELRMTMNPAVMPGTEILMRMVGQSLTVTIVNKDRSMAESLAAEAPELADSLRGHLGGHVEIRILIDEEGTTL